MRTIKEIKDLIELRTAELFDERKSKKSKKSKKMDSNLLLYKNSLLYLETLPYEDFVLKQHNDVVRKINAINNMCKERKLVTSKAQTDFKNALGMKELKQQLKHIEFILDIK